MNIPKSITRRGFCAASIRLVQSMKLLLGVSLLLALSGCIIFSPITGPGNVGNLSDADQESIALDLFRVAVESYPKDTVFSIRQKSHGDVVFARALRGAGYKVSHNGSRNLIQLDFFSRPNYGELVGAVMVGANRRVIRRYGLENGHLVRLGQSIAWPTKNGDEQTYAPGGWSGE